jgi:Flp pilus assembly protein CpaB
VAIACAGLAGVIADGYGASVAGQYGELRPVLVAARDLQRSEILDPPAVERGVEVRRVPESFVPPEALASPEDALGRAPGITIPAGSYLLASQLEAPARDAKKDKTQPRIGAGLRPVEIAVTGAEALMATGGSPEGTTVDVVVTTEPDVGAQGRTFIAAQGVELLALREGGVGSGEEGLGSSGTWSATLALTRDQALRLIEAENFARQVRLMPHVG